MKYKKYPHYVNTKLILNRISLFEYTKPEIAYHINIDYHKFLDCLYNRDFFTWKQSLDLMLLLKIYPYEIKE
jgi:hypothetical protein